MLVTGTIRPVEDDFRKLPLPTLPADGGAAVITDAELADIIRIELWKIGLGGREVQVSVSEDGVRLAGALFEHQHRDALKLAQKLAPDRAIVDAITTQRLIADASVPSAVLEWVHSSPIVYAVRHCGLDASSIAAGVKSASAELDQFFLDRRAERSRKAIITYRNLQPETVTVEVGALVSERVAALAADRICGGKSPQGLVFSLAFPRGARMLGEALETLRTRAVEQGFEEPTCYWQRPLDIDDPWPADTLTTLYAPRRQRA
jgi:hypothetical protein